MSGFVARHWRKVLVLPPLALGVALLLTLAGGKTPPVRAEATQPIRAARVITLPAVDLVPRATGFGQVTPEHVWQAVAQVAGRVVAVESRLKRGAILPEGTEVARIDPASYRLAVREHKAELKQLEVEETNARSALSIEERALEVARRDLERQRELRRTGAASQVALDQAEKAVLTAEQAVQNLRSTLNLMPARRALAEARLEQARLDLDNTSITAPFPIRVAKVNVAESQFATVGQVLAEGDSMEVAEIEAQFTYAELTPLMNAVESATLLEASGSGQVGAALQIEATVRLNTGGVIDSVVEWPARLARISDTIDPKTRTVGVIVVVEDHYGRARPGTRPPLVRNTFVEVELRGAVRPGLVVVPRLALHDGAAYVLDDDDRLVKRPVRLSGVQGDLAIVADGLSAGDRLVISDLIPAVSGMRIDPRPDPAARARLVAAAQGAVSPEVEAEANDDEDGSAEQTR